MMTRLFSNEALVDRRMPFQVDPERRYPLSLVGTSGIHDLYKAAVQDRWDAEKLVNWPELGSAGSTESRANAALLWSHRSWLEYRGIRESETALVRACLDPDCEPGVKYFLANRGSTKAVASEAAWLAASSFGGFVSTAPGSAMARLLADDVARRGLHPDMDGAAFIGGHLLVGDLVDLAVLKQMRKATGDPQLEMLLDRLLADRERHVDFSIQYLDTKLKSLPADRLAHFAACVAPAIDRELAGFRVPWWLEPDLWTERLCEAYEGAGKAGLGGGSGTDMQAAAFGAVAEACDRLSALGVELPVPAASPKNRVVE
jgi:hypothetical protein